jgi:NADP-dependent 3-hydroxy acid dehydrogenase YdfG
VTPVADAPNSGIGLMVAQALEANGAAPVYIVGRRADVLKRAAETAVGLTGFLSPQTGTGPRY